MEVTDLGFHKPQNTDKGNTIWADLAYNVDLMDELLTKHSEVVTGASLVASGDEYRKLLTVPATRTFDNVKIQVLTQESPAQLIFPKIERVSSTTFYLYLPTNTFDVKVVYV